MYPTWFVQFSHTTLLTLCRCWAHPIFTRLYHTQPITCLCRAQYHFQDAPRRKLRHYLSTSPCHFLLHHRITLWLCGYPRKSCFIAYGRDPSIWSGPGRWWTCFGQGVWPFVWKDYSACRGLRSGHCWKWPAQDIYPSRSLRIHVWWVILLWLPNSCRLFFPPRLVKRSLTDATTSRLYLILDCSQEWLWRLCSEVPSRCSRKKSYMLLTTPSSCTNLNLLKRCFARSSYGRIINVEIFHHLWRLPYWHFQCIARS